TRMGVAPVGVEAELLSLGGRRLAELRAPVSGVHAEKGGKAVQIALAVLVPDVTALPAHEHRHLVVGVRPHAREVHPEVALGLLLPRALAGRGPRCYGFLDACFAGHCCLLSILSWVLRRPE